MIRLRSAGRESKNASLPKILFAHDILLGLHDRCDDCWKYAMHSSCSSKQSKSLLSFFYYTSACHFHFVIIMIAAFLNHLQQQCSCCHASFLDCTAFRIDRASLSCRFGTDSLLSFVSNCSALLRFHAPFESLTISQSDTARTQFPFVILKRLNQI